MCKWKCLKGCDHARSRWNVCFCEGSVDTLSLTLCHNGYRGHTLTMQLFLSGITGLKSCQVLKYDSWTMCIG